VLPIQIYLDSSDFSDIVNVKKKPPEYSKVIQYLVEKRDQGFIQIRFSEAHVVEASAKSPDAIDSATERLKVIQLICGNNSLIHPIDLINFEVSFGDSSNVEESRTTIFRNDGSWMPSLFNLSEIIPDVEDSVRKDVEKMGREAKRKYLKNGRPTSLWYGEMRAANSTSANILVNNLPLTSEAVRTVKKYFMGEASRDDALRALHISITKLENFGNWYAKDWQSASAISSNLRLIGKEFETALADAREEFEALKREQNEFGITTKDLLKMSQRAFREVLAGSSSELVNKLASQIGSTPKPIEDSWKASPGLTCSITLAMHIARRSVATKLPRRPMASDFPDCYHAIYLPYVDVFRADSFVAGILQECKLPFSTLIVDNFLQLPSMIEKLLEEKNLNKND
jgi:hypothetical protein